MKTQQFKRVGPGVSYWSRPEGGSSTGSERAPDTSGTAKNSGGSKSGGKGGGLRKGFLG